MNETVAKALSLWGMMGAEVTLIAARENAVFRARKGDASVAIRLHRQGYRTDAELTSELAWMAAAARGGIAVPAPIPSCEDALLHHVDGFQIDVLTWLPGAPLSTPGGPLTIKDRVGTFHLLGQEMARLHAVSDTWQPPPDFTRCRWDREGLLGEGPLWDRFWENPGLSADERTLLSDLRTKASKDLKTLDPTLDFGLIHADLVSANVMTHAGRIALIDFDDGGYGYRLFEVATALLKHKNEPDFPELQEALITGYRAIRALDTAALDLFLAIRAATYVGWNISRMHEPGAKGRNARFIQSACREARAYLGRMQ